MSNYLGKVQSFRFPYNIDKFFTLPIKNYHHLQKYGKNYGNDFLRIPISLLLNLRLAFGLDCEWILWNLSFKSYYYIQKCKNTYIFNVSACPTYLPSKRKNKKVKGVG